jgi:predicted SAM-dependent methyltransferase
MTWGRAEAAIARAAGGAVREASSGRKKLKLIRNAKVNIGCGSLILEGWVNLDVSPAPGAEYTNVMNGLPFSDGAASHIHCEHFLEHLDYPVALSFLAECHRILRPQGTMRIIVPDAGKYLAAYCRNDQTFFGHLTHLGNAVEALETRMHVINQMFRMGGDHKYSWDFETLHHACRRTGFTKIQESVRGDVPPDLNIDGTDSWRELESLYANIRK